MFNIKSIAKAAGAGFVLSFVISIFSTQKFGVSLGRGLIFALVFAALAAAICFLDNTFLDGTLGESASSSGSSSGKSSAPKAGSVVNITIDDESLTEEDKAPLFDVSSKRTGFARNESAPAAAARPSATFAQPSPSAAVSEAPVEKAAEPVQAPVAAAPAAPSAPVQENSQPAETPQFKPAPLQEVTSRKSVGDDDIDTLPDIGDGMAGGEDDVALSNSGNAVVTDSEFAETGTDGRPVSLVDASDATKHDTKTIADAIRTLLKKDE